MRTNRWCNGVFSSGSDTPGREALSFVASVEASTPSEDQIVGNLGDQIGECLRTAVKAVLSQGFYRIARPLPADLVDIDKQAGGPGRLRDS